MRLRSSKPYTGVCHRLVKDDVDGAAASGRRSRWKAAKAAATMTKYSISCITESHVKVFGFGLAGKLVLGPSQAHRVVSSDGFPGNFENKLLNANQYFSAILVPTSVSMGMRVIQLDMSLAALSPNIKKNPFFSKYNRSVQQSSLKRYSYEEKQVLTNELESFYQRMYF